MVRGGNEQSGFTLLELVLVMVIIAIMAGMLAPALGRFTAGRAVDNLGREMLNVAQYAHLQAISEARTYRLNFDQSAGQYWLTADNGGGVFVALKGDVGNRHTVASGLRMQVQVTPQPNIQMLIAANVEQQSVPQSATSLNGQTAAATGATMQNLHTQGTYVEFQSTGRIDPATIVLSDSTGHRTEVACASPTEMFAVVADQGVGR